MGDTATDAVKELKWLQANPAFWQRPASIEEFMGPMYLDIEKGVRPGIKRALVRIFGKKVDGKWISVSRAAMVTGAIGIGKTTIASIIIPYMVHWVSCLEDPQKFFDLLPGSRIAFMQMSTSEDQAKEVLFGDIKARIEHCEWFQSYCPYDTDFKNQLRFPKEIWVLPGNSAETTFEGYNILAGILDEGDSHKVTKDKDYADAGYDTIKARIESRFMDYDAGKHKGLIVVIGQMKKGNGFMAKKKTELEKDPDAQVVSMAIWESVGWEKFTKPDGTRDSFFYDKRRKAIVPDGVASVVENADIIEVPNAYKSSFDTNPVKALRDLAGIPPLTDDPFIQLVDRIDLAMDVWKLRAGDEPSVDDNPTRPEFPKWFEATDSLRRVVHIDMAYSAEGDALGMAMGHVSKVTDVDGEEKPFIFFDFLMRIKAAAGTEIMFSDVRRILYHLKDDRKFRITKVTLDGFQSTDTIQQLQKKRFDAEYLSVDRNLTPYYDLRDAIYERRIAFPPYVTFLNKGDTELVNIARKELTELTDTGKKVDHPSGGSKDVADAMAGVVYTLMGDRMYRRGVRSVDMPQGDQGPNNFGANSGGLSLPSHPALIGGSGLHAPVPPSGFSGIDLVIPSTLPSLERRR